MLSTIIWAILGGVALERTPAQPAQVTPVVASCEPLAQRPQAAHWISGSELRAEQRRIKGLIKLCCARSQQALGAPARAEVTLELTARAKTRTVTVETGGDHALAACLARAVRQFRFPPQTAAQTLTFPIIFVR